MSHTSRHFSGMPTAPLSPAQFHAMKVGPCQIRPTQVGARQVGSPQVCARQIGVAQVSTDKIRPGQIGANQAGFPQRCSGKIGLCQLGLGQIRTSQICATEIGPDKPTPAASRQQFLKLICGILDSNTSRCTRTLSGQTVCTVRAHTSKRSGDHPLGGCLLRALLRRDGPVGLQVLI
jgi:hypothetical protein